MLKVGTFKDRQGRIIEAYVSKDGWLVKLGGKSRYIDTGFNSIEENRKVVFEYIKKYFEGIEEVK